MENKKSTEHWPKIDLLQGQLKSYFTKTKNEIFTQEYNSKLSILISVLYTFINPASLTLIVTIILFNLYPSASPYTLAIYATQLAIIFCASIVKEILINKIKLSTDSKINKRTAKVHRGKQVFESQQWGNIQLGDIVYLVQGQAVPADIIVLDSQQIQHREAITYVDVKRLNGEIVCQKKKSCYLTQLLNRSSTQKRVWQEYRKILSGRVTYEKSSQSMDSFTGYLKLLKDPKVQKLSIQNLILRESIIKTSLWVYGLVVYPGMDSKVMKNLKGGNQNRKWGTKKMNNIFWLILIANLLLGTIFTILYKFTALNPYQNASYRIFYHFFMFSIMLPHFLFIAHDLFQIILMISHKDPQIQVRDYANLQQIGEVSYAMIANVGVLTNGQLQVNQIVTQSSIYAFDSEYSIPQRKSSKKSSGLNGRRIGSFSRNQQSSNSGIKQINNRFLLPIMNYDKRSSALVFKDEGTICENDNFEIDDDTNVRLRQSSSIKPKVSKLNAHLQPLKLDRNRFYNYVKRNQNESIQIIKALGLCHQAKLNYVAQKDKYQAVSNVNSEEILLKLVNYVGWSLMPKIIDKKQIGITIFQQKQKLNGESGTFTFQTIKTTYYWTGINSFHISRKLFSVVVTNQDRHTLYCKGKPQDIIQRLKVSKETQKIIQQTISSYAKKQSEILIYAKRNLSEQEKQIYENDYISLKSSLTTTEHEIEQFSKRYEKNLQLICIIGMSTQVNQQAEQLIKNVRNSGVKPCIFVEERSQVSSMRKLILNENQIIKDVELEGSSAQRIKYYLNEATNLLHNNEQFKYGITVSGKAWDIIQESSQIMQHFMFVLYYAQALIAINFKPEAIALLTNKIRNAYPEVQKILGIGYSYSDIKFLAESNVSISTFQDLLTDVKVQGLQKIIQTLKLGPSLLAVKHCKKTVVMYRLIAITTVTIIYQIIMASYRTSQTINGFLVFFYLVIYSCLEVAYNIYNYIIAPSNESIKCKDFRLLKKIFYLQYIQSFIHGAMIIISLNFNLAGAKIYGSKILPVQALDLAVFITLILVGCLRNILNSRFTLARFGVTTLITILTMILSLFICATLNAKFAKVAIQIMYLIQSYDSITSIINCTIFCLALSVFIQEIVKKKLMNSNMRIAKIKEVNKKTMNKKMTELIRHLYQSEENMQNSLQQIAASEVDVNELKIKKSLMIKSEEENLKFLSQRIGKNRMAIIKLIVVMFFFFTTAIVVQLANQQKGFNDEILIATIGAVICIIALAFILFNKQIYFCSYYFFSGFIGCMTALLFAYTYYCNHNSNFLLICLLSVVITQNVSINFFVIVFLLSSLIVFGFIIAILTTNPIANKIIYPFFEIVCILFNFYLFYQVQLSERLSFVSTQSFEKQSNYANDILSILVPKFIKNHLQGNEYSLQQQQKKVSILFCYVCNFDQIVKQEGTNVVSLMDELFRQFDQLCHNYAVQKIETVGQTYMAATGIKAYQDQIETEMKKKNQVQRLLKMGIQMLEKSKDIMWGIKKNKKLNIKIGIHHGNVIIGVIGFHKPQFSLIGDAVNTTSRHCSTAGPGQIVISAVAHQLLRKFPASSFTKAIKNMKGLGEVSVYKYNNNLGKQKSHMLMRIKFQNAVKKVIQNLKLQGKINYKKFKASQFAERAILHQRFNTKKITKISEPRRSIQIEVGQIENILQNAKEIKTGNSEMCVQYNKFLQLTEKNPKFKKHLITKHLYSDRLSLCILVCIYIIDFVSDILNKSYKIQSLAISSIGLVLLPIMFLLYKTSIKHRSIGIAFIIAHSYLILAVSLSSILTQNQSSSQILVHIGDFYGIMAVAVCSSQKAFRFLHNLALAIVAIIVSAVTAAISQNFQISLIYQWFFLILILIRKYSYLKDYYENYNQTQIYEKKTQEQSALVSQLLPKHAYEKLKNQNIENKLELTDRFEYATILFADIKGFTSYSNKNTPAGVVRMLRQLFEEFDKLCLKYNVYKVYTIGDCYVVLGFTNCYQRDFLQQAKNVVNMGLAMVETIQKVRETLDFMELDMRIGVHTGTLIGGIIGTEIVRYDIYGPDVMVANKFEQYGKTGHIHISQSTKQILDQDKKRSFNIVPNGIVKVEKLNAEYNGYILTKKKFEI